jgi:benzaldehyde dehydrogenase (NAD)
MKIEKTASTALIGDVQLAGSYFNGTWVVEGEKASVNEPATGESLGEIALASPEAINASALAARRAQTEWAALKPDERATVFHRAIAIAEEHHEEIVTWLIREGGGARAKAEYELAVTVKSILLAAAMPHQPQGLVLPSEPGRLSLARRRPRGVIGIIAPFNFPLYLAMRAVAPALAVGNSVVLKPDPRTAICGGHVIARLFELAGLPEGVLHVLAGGGDAGEALCSDPNIAMIQFTGSTNAGRAVGETASRHLKKVSLELGGKNSIVILDDADLDLAVRNVAWGVYLHQGQICMSAGRILVHEAIADQFIAALSEKAASLKVGNPVDDDTVIGPLINKRQLDHVEQVVRDSVAAGATLKTGGFSNDLFYTPTVLTGVVEGMPAFDQEVFGPVAAVTTFKTDDEAVALANRTEYGLSAAVISRDVSRAMKLGDRLQTGLLHINDQTGNDDVVNPFGGVGASGNGASIGGPANWEEFTEWQWVTIKGAAPAYPF